MSDSVDELVRDYRENVVKEEHPRSIGLFTIPEYPELEKRGMWSSAVNTILTTLRYIAPATLITLLWGQQSFLFRILKYIDSAFRAIVFSSEEQKQAVLQWLAEAGPVRVEHLDTVWRHGWILCGVLDAALPGACAGHPPTRISIKHAQAIADHYLGVEPVFSHQELDSNDSLSRHQEWKFVAYLDRIRQALSKLTPPVSKPVSQRTSPETNPFVLDYVAKGSGLSAIQTNNKAYFKIYPTSQQILDPADITILIRGPKDTYGMIVIPPILGKAQMIRHKLLGLQTKPNYTENALPLTQGATYLRAYGKNDMNKTYYIPKAQYDIEINVDSKSDHVKISYVVKLDGKYLVSITSRGQSIVGSPFSVTASNNIISILEKDNYCLEDGEEIDIVDVKTDRKIVLRIVDFVTEKMLLKENGTLERISDNEAKHLMTTAKENERHNLSEKVKAEINSNICETLIRYKFNKAVHKIMLMQKVCKMFIELIIQKQSILHNKLTNTSLNTRNKQGIPDIVNSTLIDTKGTPYIIPEKREKIIVPESISVSLRAEISKPCYDEIIHNSTDDIDNLSLNTMIVSNRCITPDSLDIKNPTPDYLDTNISLDKIPSSTVNNPFMSQVFEENHAATQSFVASQYSQNEEARDSSITIMIDSDLTQTPGKDILPSPINNNPFIETNVEFERPKTPVYKIIAGEKLARDESIFIDPKSELIPEEELGNEFINPFFMHDFETRYFSQAPMTDFIIGAPVSLPPLIRTSTPEPKMTSLILTESKNIHTSESIPGKLQKRKVLVGESEYLTTQNNASLPNKETLAISPAFHSADSSLTETIDNCNTSTTSDSQFEPDQSDSDRNVTPRRDMWDSAYVSIDDNNSSPDTNNNEQIMMGESLNKHRLSVGNENIRFNQEEISKMGPAEREIWQTCDDLKCDVNKPKEDIRQYKWELKRPIFTPIIEESDRSISLSSKDISNTDIPKNQIETDTVSVAFAELNDLYQEYFPKPETNSSSITDVDNTLYRTQVENVKQYQDISVNSASETSDVKRHRQNEKLGGISEVQLNATESVSASQSLHNECNHFKYSNENKLNANCEHTRNCSNIVLEKKKFWDERIREIEAKTQATADVPKKRRVCSKQLKHDSLSKRKGKQMVKNFLSVGDYTQVKDVNNDSDKLTPLKMQPSQESNEMKKSHHKVEKWKKYWDDRLELDQLNHQTEVLKNQSSKVVIPEQSQQSTTTSGQTVTVHGDDSKVAKGDRQEVTKHHHVKHEVSEEVFKAFETSPKRFFGTSRKQIMHKIDGFLGNPAEMYNSNTDLSMCHETGLVSSRISLFHNMSNTEELPWSKRKCQSLYNISTGTENEKNKSSEVGHDTDTIKPNSSGADTIKSDANIDCTHLKTKRSRMMQNTYRKTLDETVYENPLQQKKSIIVNDNNIASSAHVDPDVKFVLHEDPFLRKKLLSKSEMDIFNKLPSHITDNVDKYQSCDKLPQINVKNFISLYESVSKTTVQPKAMTQVNRTSSAESQKSTFNSIKSSAVRKSTCATTQPKIANRDCERMMPGKSPTNLWRSKTLETVSNNSLDSKLSDSYDVDSIMNEHKETMYLSLSDIELEIIESPDKSIESTPEKQTEPAHIEYKNRFKRAKQYFQSLEELREIQQPRKLNECELLLCQESTECLQDERPQYRVKKNIKSHSLPSSEIAKVWNQLHERQERGESEESTNTKLVKISEKFNVDDLFSDVTEGKLSRQGSLRGIPHKKAVLEAFRSMENVADLTTSSYEISDHLIHTDFDRQHSIKNAQTYLKEYPYLPTTDPSKCHSRIDIGASGLISLKELKERRQRRNSVPDLRLNPNFTADL